MRRIGRMYSGPAPCVGCGTPGSEEIRRSKDELCGHCRAVLDIGKQAIARTAKDRKSGELIAVTFFGIRVPLESGKWTPHSEELEEKLARLMHAIDRGESGECASRKIGRSGDYASTRNRATFHTTPEICDRLEELLTALGEYGYKAYRDGFDQGSSILERLSEGDLSLSAFEERRAR